MPSVQSNKQPLDQDTAQHSEEIKSLQRALKHLKIENRRLIAMDIQHRLAEILPVLPIVKYNKKILKEGATEDVKIITTTVTGTEQSTNNTVDNNSGTTPEEETLNVKDGEGKIASAIKFVDALKLKKEKESIRLKKLPISEIFKPNAVAQTSDEVTALMEEIYQLRVSAKVVDLNSKEKWQMEERLRLQELHKRTLALKEKVSLLRSEKLKIPAYQATVHTETPALIGRIFIPNSKRSTMPSRVLLRPTDFEKLHSVFVS